MRPAARSLAAFALLVLMAGCRSQDDPFRVATVQMGTSLNADKTVARHTTTFTPGDTIYVSVITAGNGSGAIQVRWWIADRLVSERTAPVSSRDAPVMEFRLQSTGPFPLGNYRAEIFLDGRPVETRPFRVVKER